MKILLVGATGLVGKEALSLALADPRVEQVAAPTRKPLPAHPKLISPIVDFDHLPEDAPWWKADALVCTLGTTMKQAGSKEAFRKVDFDYVLAVAKLCRAAGTPTMALTTALGASVKSAVFYNRVKGECEGAVSALGFASLVIVRPSMLDGGPRPQPRLGEHAMLGAMRALRVLIPARYRSVRTAAVARALLQAALEPKPGVTVIENEAITAV